jgi:predicted PurR-regulated permease PerM
VSVKTRIRIGTSIFLAHFLASLLILLLFRNLHYFQLFEQLILTSILAAIFIFAIFYLLRRVNKRQNQNFTDYIYLIIVASLLFAFLAPNCILNIDRSRSFYVLSWVDQNEISFGADGKLVTSIKSPEALNISGVRERISEQINRGLIVRDKNRLSLTFSGRIVLRFSNFVAQIYNLDGWFRNRQ